MTDYKFRDGIQAIVYREIDDKREFLVLHRVKNWVGWEFPKGGIKPGENHREALIRELSEECGIMQSSIDLILPTNTNIRIDYPKDVWEKAKYRGAFYKNFLVKLNPSSEITIEKNDEPEHDGSKWILESEESEYLKDQKLLKALNNSNMVLESYLKVIDLAINIQKASLPRFVGLLMYGSRTQGKNSNDSDFDIVLVLTKPADGDLLLLNKCKKEKLKIDFQLFHLEEVSKSGNFTSLDSSGSFSYFNLKNAITILGMNPWESVEKPDEKLLEMSILAKTQYYIYRLRQLLLSQSKNNTDLLYFTKRLPLVIRMIMLLKGTWYLNVDEAMEDFKSSFPDTLDESEIEKLKSAVNNGKPLDSDYLYFLYMKVYHSCISYLKQNSSLVTLDEIPIERKV